MPIAIAGQGGTNFQEKTPYLVTGFLQSATETTLLSISGSGLLVCISMLISTFTNGNRSGRFRVIADGVDYGLVYLAYNFGVNSTGFGSSHSPFIKFNSTLVVKHVSSADIVIQTAVSYLLD